ncbi:Acetylornithine aminotransferase [Lactococcus lactis]|nr:Acetylornithine aminotransferase [Lactococcus lactis]
MKRANAVKVQLDSLSHLSNLYQNPLQEDVAEKLSQNHSYKAFFCNSGTEANEAALKLTRLIKAGHKILAFTDGFHGRTFGAMSATMQEKIQAGFAPLLPDFVATPYNDVAALQQVVENEKIGAIIFEIVQGEGGVLPIRADFVEALKTCQQKGILLIVDEVQTGIGRTGKFFLLNILILNRIFSQLLKPWQMVFQPAQCWLKITMLTIFLLGNMAQLLAEIPWLWPAPIKF